MKTFYIGESGCMIYDPETQNASGLPSKREGIRRIFLAEEPMHVVSELADKRDEFDVKKDDLIVTFYETTYEKRAVVVKSKDWVKNLKAYDKREQELKERWASEKVSCNEVTQEAES